MGLLTEADQYFLKLALRENGGFHLATEWYLRGWVPLSYQYAYHQVRQMNTTFLAGVAAGKTASSAVSVLMDCLSIPYFRALNTSVTAKQAELGFDMFMGWYEGNDKLEHLIEDIKLRPWPVIKFKNFSEWEFRTAGTDARFIRGSEYDRIVYDECGLDFIGETVKVLRGRLRGTRPDSTKRMARMDTITSPTDALWLRERYERGLRGSDKADLRRYISFKIRTKDNTRLTDEQIALMEAEYTDEDIDVEMNAEFPDYGMSDFPKRHVNACTDQALNDIAYIALNPEDSSHPKKGFEVEEHPRHGITKFEMPCDPKGIYIMSGDPGVDDPPKRNTGVVGVLNVAKRPAQMVYFHWVHGRGSYNPFLGSYKYAIMKYRPSIKMIDTTGPQKGIEELAFTNLGIETDSMHFAQMKDIALNHLSLAVSNHEMNWPVVKGLLKQMGTYKRRDDKPSSKIPQDIVMMLAMLALGMQYAPDVREEDHKEDPRGQRIPRKKRTRGRRR